MKFHAIDWADSDGAIFDTVLLFYNESAVVEMRAAHLNGNGAAVVFLRLCLSNRLKQTADMAQSRRFSGDYYEFAPSAIPVIPLVVDSAIISLSRRLTKLGNLGQSVSENGIYYITVFGAALVIVPLYLTRR